MAKYGSDDLVIEVDNAGGSLVDLSEYMDEYGEISAEAMLQDHHPAGETWMQKLFTGTKQLAPVTFGGFYDDTATTGPDAVIGMAALGSTRTLAVTYGSTKKTTVECIVSQYVRKPVSKELTRFAVTLTPTGAPTEA